jgi:hypothetical protein
MDAPLLIKGFPLVQRVKQKKSHYDFPLVPRVRQEVTKVWEIFKMMQNIVAFYFILK